MGSIVNTEYFCFDRVFTWDTDCFPVGWLFLGMDNLLHMSLDLSLIANFLANYLSEIDRDSLSLTQRAYNVLLDWISGHPHLIAKLGDSGLPTGAVARMVKQNEIAIKSSYFQKLLLENDFSDVKVVAQAFKHAGLLHPEMKDGLQARVTFGATKVQTYRIILKNDID